MRIHWLVTIGGMVEGNHDGVVPGMEMDVPDLNGARYIANGYAVEIKGKGATPPPEERAVAPEPEVEKAVPPDNVERATPPAHVRTPRPPRK